MSYPYKDLDLDDVERQTRRVYLAAKERGMTHAEMSIITGLPMSTFSMWLSGYRSIIKVDVLNALVQHAGKVAGR